MSFTRRIFKHYLLVGLGILYFVCYFLFKIQLFDLASWFSQWKLIFSYFSAAIAVFTSFSVLSIILRSTRKFIIHLWRKRSSKVYPILSGMALKFMSYANYIISLYIGFTLLVIPKAYIWIANRIVSTVFIIVALVVLSNLVIVIFEKRWVFRLKFANNLSNHLSSIIKKILLVFIWVTGGITIISNLGYDVSALIAWAWIWWLALALGAQKSLTNVFWAITIVLNKPFRIGDYVKIEDTVWSVKDIGISYLTIIEKWWHQVMIPNEVIMTSFVENYTVRENRRTEITLSIQVKTPKDKVELAVTMIKDILEWYRQEGTIEKYRVNFDKFWVYSIDIQITYFSLLEDYEQYLDQKQEINYMIKMRFKKQGIKIAMPTRNLIISKKKKKKKKPVVIEKLQSKKGRQTVKKKPSEVPQNTEKPKELIKKEIQVSNEVNITRRNLMDEIDI